MQYVLWLIRKTISCSFWWSNKEAFLLYTAFVNFNKWYPWINWNWASFLFPCAEEANQWLVSNMCATTPAIATFTAFLAQLSSTLELKDPWGAWQVFWELLSFCDVPPVCHKKNAMWLVTSGIFFHLAILLTDITKRSCSVPTEKASRQSEVIKTSGDCLFPRGMPLAPPGRQHNIVYN